MLAGLLNGLGAQTRPYLDRMREHIIDALTQAYVDAYGEPSPNKFRNARIAFQKGTIIYEGRIIYTSTAGVNDTLLFGGMPTIEDDAEGVSGMFTLSILAEESLKRQGFTAGGFDAFKSGVGYFIEEAFVEQPSERVPHDFVKEAQMEAEAGAAAKSQSYGHRYGRREYEIKLVNPRTERKTLHGLRRR